MKEALDPDIKDPEIRTNKFRLGFKVLHIIEHVLPATESHRNRPPVVSTNVESFSSPKPTAARDRIIITDPQQFLFDTINSPSAGGGGMIGEIATLFRALTFDDSIRE